MGGSARCLLLNKLFYQIQEIGMNARIFIELRMEGRNQLIALPGSYNVLVNSSQYLAFGGEYLNDSGGSDKRHGYLFAHSIHTFFGMETAQLSAVGIAFHLHLHGGQMRLAASFNVLGQQNQTGTSAKHRQALADGRLDGFEQPEFMEQFRLNRRLATWNDQSVFGLLPVGQLSNLEGFDAQPL